jgi:hypothetical protein
LSTKHYLELIEYQELLESPSRGNPYKKDTRKKAVNKAQVKPKKSGP